MKNSILGLMKRINFSNYVRQLPSNMVLEYLSDIGSSKILTNGVYEKITKKFCEENYIEQTLQSVSANERAEIFQVYICGDFGKKISSQSLKTKVLKTFLAFEGIDENSDTLFGFPDLSPLIARYFAQNLSVCEELSRPLYFSSTLLSDFAIILDMFQNSESKICTDKTYSQRWTELLKERCGIGKLLTTHEELDKILDFVLVLSKSLGAKFSDTDSKLTLLSSAEQLLNRAIEETNKDLPKIIANFSKCIDFQFLRSLVGKNEGQIKLDITEMGEIAKTIDFSLKFFHWCGLIELASNDEKQSKNVRVFQIKTSDFTSFENGHILPDFNVYIPIGVNPKHLSKILYSTKICSVDVIYRGKIDKQRLEKALVNGIEEREITEILQEWKVPQSLLTTIQEWIHSFNRAFADLPYIAFRNDVAAVIASHEQLKEKLSPIDGYTFFKVKEGEENSVFETLGKIGFDLRKIAEKNTLPLEEDEDEDDIPCKFNKNPQFHIKQEYILV
ncbi:MAG: hypothetical protein FWE23_03400 [Chitinivibrionia bacterium]|nr:hypothetical protein [Chitinivibrionia bacterium]